MRKIRDFIYDWLDREESFIFWMVVMFGVISWISWGFYRFFQGNSWGFWHEFLIISCDVAISFFTVLVIDVILYLTLRKFKVLHKITKSLFLAVNAVLFVTDIFTIYYFKTSFNVNMFEFLTRTNVREASEFLQVYLINSSIWKFAAIIIIPMIIFRVLWVKILNSRPRLRLAVFAFCFMLSILASGRQFYLINNIRSMRFVNSVGVSKLVSLIYNNQRNKNGYEKSLAYTRKAITLTKNKSKIPYVVFILGESTTRNHMSLYGYNLPTNPLLSLRSLRGGG